MAIKTKEEAMSRFQEIARAHRAPHNPDALSTIIDLLIELGVWTPEEPENPVEKTNWQLLDEFIDWAPTVDSDTVVEELQIAAQTLGLKLIKQSDELVEVDMEVARASIAADFCSYIKADAIIIGLNKFGYVISKRAGA
ncbi:hypothetical protein [Rhodopseudomonas sp. B29]|uniref:hypothetical protein n=1 Tax=Rhodopseudomonas sp. B29 TaxID=95607 RepID=UPI0003B31FB9|nr:hypothetical protein [Rhodopseudomonas sp. B29]